MPTLEDEVEKIATAVTALTGKVDALVVRLDAFLSPEMSAPVAVDLGPVMDALQDIRAQVVFTRGVAPESPVEPQE